MANISATECAHCGLPVPAPRVGAQGEPSFCCAGCETVFSVLHEAGLEEYYAFRERLGEPGSVGPVVPALDGYEELDSQAFSKLYCTVREDGTVETELLLEGVHCAACVWLVERLPRLEPAVARARLDMGRATVTLEFDPKEAPLSQIAATLAKMGYKPRPARGRAAERMRRDELRRLLVRMGVAGASAGNVMLMAFALYSGAGETVGVHEADTMHEATRRFFFWASFIVSLPALWAGSLFFRGAFYSLRTRTPHMDLPIALGISAGFVWGVYGVVSGAGEIYFDSITTLIFFLLIGRYLQRRHQMQASEAAELLHAVMPARADRLNRPLSPIAEGSGPSGAQNGAGVPGAQSMPNEGDELTAGIETISTESIELGDHILVESGRIIPVDGTVVWGRSNVDRSLLSGESRPVGVAKGAQVEAGAVNLGQRLIIAAERSGAETRVGRLMREVERAMSERAPLVAHADRLAGVFTVVVLALAGAVGGYWAWAAAPAVGVERSLALLIVACPCALGMATPLALNAAVSQAARLKQLIFGAETIERLAAPATIVLDKTGTLTEGTLEVVAFSGDAGILPAVAMAERGAHHPVARALIALAGQRAPDSESSRAAAPNVRKVREVPGKGLEAEFDGGELLIGSRSFVLGRARLDADLARELEAGKPACSPLLVACAGEVVALAWMGDRLRADAAESIVSLAGSGHELFLLSGDDPVTVSAAAQELGRQAGRGDLFKQVWGGVSPEQKLAYVRKWQAEGRRIIMVGDGVNDAGALAAADVGVAVSGAAEASRLSADVFLARPGVAELVTLIRGARATLRTIRRGIVFSLGYNVVGVSLAALGLLGPLTAAVLMPLSSLTVVTNAYRSRMFLPREHGPKNSRARRWDPRVRRSGIPSTPPPAEPLSRPFMGVS